MRRNSFPKIHRLSKMKEYLVWQRATGRNKKLRTGYGPGAISILTDARHGCRRNAKDTNLVYIGDSTHNVIRKEHVTRTDNQCTQRDKLLGTKRLYDYFDNDIPSVGGPVRVHIHSFKNSKTFSCT